MRENVMGLCSAQAAGGHMQSDGGRACLAQNVRRQSFTDLSDGLLLDLLSHLEGSRAAGMKLNLALSGLALTRSG